MAAQKLSLAVLLLAIISYSIGQEIDSSINKEPPQDDDTVDVKESLNAFSLAMYRNVSKTNGNNRNVFLAPISIYQALAMLEAGASGKTEKELMKLLATADTNRFPHEEVGKWLKSAFKTHEGVTLKSGNRLWIQKDVNVKSDYLNLLKENYNLKLKKLNFRNKPEESRAKINKWVSDKTNGHIKNLLKQGTVDSETRLVLTNAIHFKGTWATLFKKIETRKGTFNYFDEKGKQASARAYFMTRIGMVLYNRMEESDIQVIDLPYTGEKYSFSLFLPALESSSRLLTLDEIKEGLKEMKKIKMKLMLPRFEIKEKYELGKILSEMGLHTLFSTTSSLTKMTDERVLLTNVIHQANINVNEKGTEASGATAVVLGRSFLPVFKVDRPFTFVIRERKSGTILFIGKFNKP